MGMGNRNDKNQCVYKRSKVPAGRINNSMRGNDTEKRLKRSIRTITLGLFFFNKQLEMSQNIYVSFWLCNLHAYCTMKEM